MPGEFHLSIKNAQRKIVDVRDLFKNMTTEEMEILEKAKIRSEEEKRIKQLRENEEEDYMSQKENQYTQNIEKSKRTAFSSQPNLQKLDLDKPSISSSNLLVTSAYVDDKEANLCRRIRLRDSDHQQMVQKHRSMMFIPKNADEDCSKSKQMNRYLSHVDVNELPKENANYFPHYNIIQKVSVKKPPKPKTVIKNLSPNQKHMEISTISTDSSSNNGQKHMNYTKKKPSQNPPRTPPQMSIPKAKMTKCTKDEDNKCYFNGFKDRMKHFLEVDKKLLKFRSTHVNTHQRPMYTSEHINYQAQSPPVQSYFVTNQSEKIIRSTNSHTNEIYAYEPSIPMYYNFNHNSNGSINNLNQVPNPPHPNIRQHCPSHSTQRIYQPHQYFHAEPARPERLKYQHSSNQSHFKRPTPSTDRITAFFNRTKNFRF